MDSLGSLSGLADKDERLANVLIGLSYFRIYVYRIKQYFVKDNNIFLSCVLTYC